MCLISLANTRKLQIREKMEDIFILLFFCNALRKNITIHHTNTAVHRSLLFFSVVSFVASVTHNALVITNSSL